MRRRELGARRSCPLFRTTRKRLSIHVEAILHLALSDPLPTLSFPIVLSTLAPILVVFYVPLILPPSLLLARSADSMYRHIGVVCAAPYCGVQLSVCVDVANIMWCDVCAGTCLCNVKCQISCLATFVSYSIQSLALWYIDHIIIEPQ